MARKRESTEKRQGQIIDAARRVVVKYGSEHVTVGRIAREVGISEGAVYRHFKSKREVLSRLAELVAEDLLQDVSRKRAGNVSPLEIIDGTLNSHLSLIQQRRGTSFQVIAEIVSLGDKKLNRKISEAIVRYINGLKDLLCQGIEAGEVKEDIDTEAAAMLMFGMIQGLVNIWALSGYAFDLEERYDHLWKVYREAIVKK